MIAEEARLEHSIAARTLRAMVIAMAATACAACDTRPPAASTPPAPTATQERPRDPAEIRFPPGAAREPLAAAQAAHREALERYKARDRKAGNERAREALRLYAEAGALVPELSDLHYEVVVDLTETASLADAGRETEGWLRRFPRDALHRETLGKLLFRAGRYPEAARELSAALELKPGDVPTLRRLVQSRAFEGARDGALQAANELLRAAGLQPLPPAASPAREGEVENLIVAATAFSRFQEHGTARPLWERLAALRPDDGAARLEWGLCLKGLGRHDEAVKALEPLRSDAKLGTEALRESATCLAKDGRHADAVRLLIDALSRDPALAGAYHQLADGLRRLGNDDAAGAMDRASAALAPSERERARVSEHRAAGRGLEARFTQAQALAYAGKYRLADDALNEPELKGNATVALRRARLYIDWLRVEEAAQILDGLTEQGGLGDPEVEALRARCRALLEPREAPDLPDPTRRELRLAVARTPWPDASPLLVALARAEDGSDRTQALAAARLACASDPRRVEAWRTVAGLLREPEDVFYRLEALNELLRLEPADEAARGDRDACRRRIEKLVPAR